ncbi:transposase [Cohaesibacter celericrescens]|uniref:transposase n=1 Tax=Cohaesibacter celericrescens TaxID=2067669 RepID=UPI003568CAE4
MTKHSPFRYFKTSPEIIRLAVMLYVRFPLSLRNVEDLLHERGIDVSYETIRFWWNRFGPIFASEIRRKRVQRSRCWTQGQWHMDEVFVKINGETHYLWRAVDHEGEVLRSYGAAMKEIGNVNWHETGRWRNNRAENSHLLFRRRERAMNCFRRMRTLQNFVSIHAAVYNHFNQERGLYSRLNFKLNRSIALAEWLGLCAG